MREFSRILLFSSICAVAFSLVHFFLERHGYQCCLLIILIIFEEREKRKDRQTDREFVLEHENILFQGLYPLLNL